MSWKNVRTASLEQSIWSRLPENTFRQHLVVLEERTNAVPIDAQRFTLKDWSLTDTYPPSNLYTLPVEVEQQIADDFACLAAVEEGAQSVAAVCIEENSEFPGLTLRFAALDTSLNECVKGALQDASSILAEIASDVHADATALACKTDAFFKRVIELHANRLLARLRSVKWEKPKHLVKSHKKSLWQDFANVIHRAQFLYTKREKRLRQLIEKTLLDLATVYESFEAVPADTAAEILALSALVNASLSFCLMNEVQDYARRLESSTSTKPTKQVGSAIKCLRQIEKIAAYRRMCTSLVERAKQYPILFRNGLRLKYLTPYNSVPTTIGYEDWAKTCHVHAEVQLAVHYDLVRQSNDMNFLPPRTIGISKWLCYLCYQFLRAHKQFFPSKTHGRLYDQWTIPDLVEFRADTRQCYREIIQEIDAQVVRQTENEPELWRIEPMTSRQDLLTL